MPRLPEIEKLKIFEDTKEPENNIGIILPPNVGIGHIVANQDANNFVYRNLFSVEFPEDLHLNNADILSVTLPQRHSQFVRTSANGIYITAPGRVEWGEASIIIRNNIRNQTIRAINDWIDSGRRYDIGISQLDINGAELCYWELLNCHLVRADFGDLAYRDVGNFQEFTLGIQPQYCQQIIRAN